MKILHICFESPIINDYIKLINNNFNPNNHFFIFIANKHKFNQKNQDNILYYNTFNFKKNFFCSLQNTVDLIKRIKRSQKVILHGLFFPNSLLLVLAFIPFLYKKYYWVIWGGDLYDYLLKKNCLRKFAKRIMCRKINHVLTYVKGDYELARNWYHIKSQYHECIMYPSNFYKEIAEQPKTSTTLNILIGNSANSSNNHKEILDKLKPYKDWNVKIYAPLSYGGEEKYVKAIEQYGKDLFGNKFEALTNLIPLTEYNKFLSNIHIAIFAYKRQQGMGNIISLLGMEKMVFIRSDITPYQLFCNMGIKVFPFESLSLPSKENLPKLSSNREIIKKHFNKEILLNQLTSIFNY